MENLLNHIISIYNIRHFLKIPLPNFVFFEKSRIYKKGRSLLNGLFIY